MTHNSLNEKLGYSDSDKVVIFHIDDIGFCHASNIASFECLDFGITTCGSIIVPSPWFLETAALYRQNPSYDVGVHLTLTSEYSSYRWRPLSTVDPQTGLIDEEGYMPHLTEDVFNHVNPKAAEREMRAQVKFALSHGIDVTHIDSHMGTVFHPKFLQSYLEIANEFKIPAFLPKITKEQLIARGFGEYIDIYEELKFFIEQSNFPVLDDLISGTGKVEEDAVKYFCKRFSEIKPGITHFLIHAAKASPELRSIMQASIEVESGEAERNQDYEAFTDNRIKECVEKYDLKLVGYRGIREIVRQSIYSG